MDELFGDVFDRGLVAAAPRRLLARRRRLLRRRPAARGRARRPGRHRPGRARARDPRARADPRRPARSRRRPTRSASTSSSRSSTARSAASSRSAPTSTPTRADATYEDGMLDRRAARSPRRADPRTVPIEPSAASDRDRRRDAGDGARTVEMGAPSLPDRAAGAAAARHGHLPGHADAAGGRPGALDPARQRRAGAATACS